MTAHCTYKIINKLPTSTGSDIKVTTYRSIPKVPDPAAEVGGLADERGDVLRRGDIEGRRESRATAAAARRQRVHRAGAARHIARTCMNTPLY